MLIKNTTLDALRTTVRAEFAAAMAAFGKSDWQAVASVIPSTSASNTYGFLSDFPQMIEWVGKRKIQSIKEHAYQIANKDYESTLGVKRGDIEDNNLGNLRIRIQSHAASVDQFKNEGVFNLLSSGFSTLCYDGQNFFDVDHPVNAKRDGSGTARSVSNIVGSALATGTPWYLLSTSYPLKPLIWQERTAAVMESNEQGHSDHLFMENEFLFGIRARGAFCYGFWQQAVACKETLNATNLKAARELMMGFKKDGETPMGIRPNLLVVPHTLEAEARELVKAERKANGASNVNFNIVDMLATPWL